MKANELKKSKSRLLWDLVTETLATHGDMVDNIHIIEDDSRDGEIMRRIYAKTSDNTGYCFEVYKQEADEENTSDVEDGFVYYFLERWDDFDTGGIDTAIEILSEHAKID